MSRQMWEQTHAERNWGKYPSEHLIRFTARNLKPLQSVLDLGCGGGASSWYLSREGFNTVSCDHSPSAVANTRTYLTNEGLGFLGGACDFKCLPFANCTFDAAVDVVSIAHNNFDDLKGIFKEVARVLKPGGKFLSIMPTIRSTRRPFMKYGTVSFLDQLEVEPLLTPAFSTLEILCSSYELSKGCRVEHFVITATRKAI